MHSGAHCGQGLVLRWYYKIGNRVELYFVEISYIIIRDDVAPSWQPPDSGTYVVLYKMFWGK